MSFNAPNGGAQHFRDGAIPFVEKRPSKFNKRDKGVTSSILIECPIELTNFVVLICNLMGPPFALNCQRLASCRKEGKELGLLSGLSFIKEVDKEPRTYK